jgi:hypothetical protein
VADLGRDRGPEGDSSDAAARILGAASAIRGRDEESLLTVTSIAADRVDPRPAESTRGLLHLAWTVDAVLLLASAF